MAKKVCRLISARPAEKHEIRRYQEQEMGGRFRKKLRRDSPATAGQLARMVRLRDVRREVPVSVRLDPEVLEWLKSKGEGHLTLTNDILLNRMEAERKSSQAPTV